jgi:histidine phosphotransferase ChpT
MTVKPVLADIQLTAFMASRICHDLVGPIGAISNGLELLEEETDEDTRAYAQEVILNSAQAAWTRLEFARLAFGASSGLGQAIDVGQAERIARGYVEEGRHRLLWDAPDDIQLDKPHARLLMIMIAVAIPALPVGGDLTVDVADGTPAPSLSVRCAGRNARIPDKVEGILSGEDLDGLDPRSILPYYAARLADEAGMAMFVMEEGDKVIFTAAPA